MKKTKSKEFWDHVKKCADYVNKRPHLRNMNLSDPWCEGHRELNMEVLKGYPGHD